MCKIKETHNSDARGIPIADEWLRKVLIFDEKPLVVADHNGAISGTEVFEAKVAQHSIATALKAFAGTLPEEIHVVAHTLDAARDSLEFFVDKKVADKKLIVLQVASTGTVRDSGRETKEGCDCVWLAMKDLHAYNFESNTWLKQFLLLTFEEALKLLPSSCSDRSAVKPDIERKCPEFLDIIFPGRIENRLAFRLLCEAAKEIEEENNKRKDKGIAKSNTAELFGLTIHAPTRIGEWLAPFGGKGEKDIPRVAGMIGSGAVKTAAETVLKAVNGNGNLSDAITKFLNHSESQNC